MGEGEPGACWGRALQARVRKAVNMGFGDASDAMDAKECIISIMKRSGDNLFSPEQGIGTV